MTLRLPTAWPACLLAFVRWVIYSARERERARTSHECEGAFFVRMRILGRTASNTMGPPKLVMSSNANGAELPKLVPCCPAPSLALTLRRMDNALVDADDDRRAGKPKLDSGGKQTDPAVFDVHTEHDSAEQLYVKCEGGGLKMD